MKGRRGGGENIVRYTCKTIIVNRCYRTQKCTHWIQPHPLLACNPAHYLDSTPPTTWIQSRPLLGFNPTHYLDSTPPTTWIQPHPLLGFNPAHYLDSTPPTTWIQPHPLLGFNPTHYLDSTPPTTWIQPHPCLWCTHFLMSPLCPIVPWDEVSSDAENPPFYMRTDRQTDRQTDTAGP